MNLYVLDDDIDFINYLCSIINDTLQVNQLVKNGDYLEKYDAYFLDIDMPNKNGIEVAREIKSLYPDSLIVFITNREDLVFDALQVFPYYFLRKRTIEKDIHIVLNRLYDKFFPVYINLETANEKIQIDISKILYVEKLGHYSYVNTMNDCFKTNKPLKWYEKELDSHIFEFVTQSVIVNVKHIKSENREYVIMNDLKKFYYSRGRRTKVRVKYINERLR